jgi:HAD superfamily hydrolase (TIGR01459 family)
MTDYSLHLSDIHCQFDAFVIDLWGVMHNGKVPYAEAIDALVHLKKLGKPVILLSNAPRRLAYAQNRLTEMGIHSGLYREIYTSGEDCYRHLKHRHDSWYATLGNKIFHIGPDRDRNLFEDLPLKETRDVANAEFILNTGTLTWESQLEDFEALLQEAHRHHIPMICANPDQVVMFGELRALCAGAIAARYQELGGFVRYHGKPFLEIYSAVLNLLSGINPQRILAIGDSLATDIKGAKVAGLHALMIIGGIHQHHFKSEEDPLNVLNRLTQTYGITPDYLAPRLVW